MCLGCQELQSFTFTASRSSQVQQLQTKHQQVEQHSQGVFYTSFLNRKSFSRLNMARGSPPPPADDNPYYKGLDAYQILEVPRSASTDDIKRAYKKQVAKWHPDKFPGDEEKKKEGNLRMEKINRAWYVLGDDDRKRRYDMYGEAGVGTSAASEEQMRRGGGPGMGGFGGGQAVDMGDFAVSSSPHFASPQQVSRPALNKHLFLHWCF